jgi:predicted nucleic acid-binding protein
MIVVVDTNIFVSALITPNNRLARILSLNSLPISWISSRVLAIELTKHHSKIVKAAKSNSETIFKNTAFYLQHIKLYDEEVILPIYWEEADSLTKDVDRDDIAFVALALQTDGILWTGDKKLADHLKKMGFNRVISTAELAGLFNIE